MPWSKCSKDWFQGVGADDRCYTGFNASCKQATDDGTLANETCETASEQFFRRAVLGVHEAEITEERAENGTLLFRYIFFNCLLKIFLPLNNESKLKGLILEIITLKANINRSILL